MTNSKNTKRAVLASVLSVVLCLAMLVGSTFAWFTDSVISGKNKIVAGNLDVELEYSTDGENWKTVDANTNLFKPTEGESATLWEPGHTEYVYLRVRNAGSLALKYQFTVNVYSDENGTKAEKTYTNMAGEDFKLSEHLVFSQTEGIAAVANREDLWIQDAAAEQKAMGDLSGLRTSGMLTAGAQNTMTFAVYMPTQVGNEANQRTSAKANESEPTIFLGITLKATQAAYENDSFGNDYDTGANGTPDHPDWGTIVTDKVTAPVNPDGDTKLANDKISVLVPADAVKEDADNLTLTIKPTQTPVDIAVDDTQAALAYEITVQGLSADNTQPIPVSLFVGKDLKNVKLYHNAQVVDDAVYNPASGVINFTTTSFSPFTALFDGELTVSDEKSLRTALLFDGAEITLEADITAAQRLVVTEGATVTLALNGHKIITPEENFQITLLNRGDLTVKNGEIVNMNTVSKFGNPAVASVSGNLVLEDCVISNKAGISGSYCVQIEGGTATLKNCTINGDRGGLAVQEDGRATVNGGTISAAYYYPLYIYGNGHSTFNGTSFIKIPKLATQAGNGGNAVIYNGIDPEYGDIGTAVFTECTFKSTRDGCSKFEIFDCFNGFTLNDCDFENVKDYPTNAPDVDEGNETNPVA